MYLDTWMIITLIISFGICSVISRRQGVFAGAVATLRLLENDKIIRISPEGEVSRYQNIEPPKKKKKRNAVI